MARVLDEPLSTIMARKGRPGGSSSILVLVTMLFAGRSYTFAMLADFRTTCVGTLTTPLDLPDLVKLLPSWFLGSAFQNEA